MADEQDPVAYRRTRMRMLAKLPPANTTRWVPHRKAAVIAAVEAGILSSEDAYRRYNLTADEYAAWKQALHDFGAEGLMVTKQVRKRSGQSSA